MLQRMAIGVALAVASLAQGLDSGDEAKASNIASAAAHSSFVWSLHDYVDPTGGRFANISCPSETMCVAVDSKGYVFTSLDPSNGASSVWVHEQISTEALHDIACPSTSLCLATGGYPEGDFQHHSAVFTSTDPSDGASATWNRSTPPGETDGHGSVSCLSASLCVLVGTSGNAALVTTDPADGAGAVWVTEAAGTGGAVSCASTSLCAQATGSVYTTVHPGTGAPWISNTHAAGTTISCPSTALCVTGGSSPDYHNGAYISTDPADADFALWQANNAEGCTDTDSSCPSLRRIACPSPGLCEAVDAGGSALTTTDPADGTSAAWNPQLVFTPYSGGECFQMPCFTGLSCPTSTRCFATYQRPDAGGVAAGTWTQTYGLTVSVAGYPFAIVTSDPTGIDCGHGTLNLGFQRCSAQFLPGTQVTLTASIHSSDGSVFVGWSGSGCSGTGTCTVAMSDDRSVTATFRSSSDFNLTVAKSGPGSGTVTSLPSGIDCGSTCTYNFPTNTQVTLTATADLGSGFAGWSGCAVILSNGKCQLTMSDDKSVTATFGGPPPVTVSGGLTHYYGHSGRYKLFHRGRRVWAYGAVSPDPGPETLTYWLDRLRSGDWVRDQEFGYSMHGGSVEVYWRANSLSRGKYRIKWRYAGDGTHGAGSSSWSYFWVTT